MRCRLNRLSVLLLIFLLACTGRAGSGNNRQGGLATGQVIPDIKCRDYPSYSYSLYLPKGYTETERLPVYVAFDPGSKGILPVTRYSELAEKYRFILVGSNDSRNGLPPEQTIRIAKALISEVQSRFGADPTRIFLTGFSGGARVSCFVGMSVSKVQGVIGCGAGLQETDQQPVHSFRYFVIAGEADPNLAEVIIQDQLLSQAGWDHRLMIIPGGHAWPPPAEMEKAILWMRGELPPLPVEDRRLADFYEIDRETALRNTLLTHFISGDTTWMKREIRKLKEQSHNAKSTNDSLIAKRLLGFLGLMSWSNSTAQLNNGLLDRAYLSLTIYRMTEPENPAVDSLFNVYYQKRNP
jgi:hypothetical protein